MLLYLVFLGLKHKQLYLVFLGLKHKQLYLVFLGLKQKQLFSGLRYCSLQTNNGVLQGSRYCCNQNRAMHVYLLGIRMVCLTGAKETFHTNK